MLNRRNIKTIRSPLVFDNDSRFVESESHTQFEHYICVSCTDITYNYRVVINVLDDPFLYYCNIIV